MEHKDAGKVANTFEEDPLHHFAKRLSATKTLRDGHIILRMTGESGGDYCLRCEGGRATLSQDVPSGNHHVELIGDAKQVLSVLEGKKDARAHFLAGGFRVKGDIRYISDLAMELGILKQPI
jgi:SCP-2 sterol transfer family protein